MARLSKLQPSLLRLGPALSRASRADAHSSVQRVRNEPWRKWYKTARWRALRIKVFTRDLFTCQQVGCGRLEGNTSLLVCDHIKPHRGSELLFWDEGNLQTMCKPCHDTLKQQAEQATLHHRGVWD